MRLTTVAFAIGLFTPAALAQEDGMALQRCVWQCLARSSGNDDPAYHQCVETVCTAVASPAAAPAVPQDSAAQPDRNTIRFVQARLAELGFDPGPIDGVYGRQTAIAVREFRAANGLGSADAIDDNLVQALRSAGGNAD